MVKQYQECPLPIEEATPHVEDILDIEEATPIVEADIAKVETEN